MIPFMQNNSNLYWQKAINSCLARNSEGNFWSDGNDFVAAYVSDWYVSTHQPVLLK